MKDMEINKILTTSMDSPAKKKGLANDPIADFKKILMQSTGEVNSQLSQADQSIQEMALGRMDIHNAMVDMEKASISFRLMMQVRNKIIAAYEEIMRMQF